MNEGVNLGSKSSESTESKLYAIWGSEGMTQKNFLFYCGLQSNYMYYQKWITMTALLEYFDLFLQDIAKGAWLPPMILNPFFKHYRNFKVDTQRHACRVHSSL